MIGIFRKTHEKPNDEDYTRFEITFGSSFTGLCEFYYNGRIQVKHFGKIDTLFDVNDINGYVFNDELFGFFKDYGKVFCNTNDTLLVKIKKFISHEQGYLFALRAYNFSCGYAKKMEMIDYESHKDKNLEKFCELVKNHCNDLSRYIDENTVIYLVSHCDDAAFLKEIKEFFDKNNTNQQSCDTYNASTYQQFAYISENETETINNETKKCVASIICKHIKVIAKCLNKHI